jgi:hypothetical protein
MLGRDHDAGGLDRPAVLVAHGDLRLRVGPEPRLLAGLARLGEAAQDGMGVVDRRRHQLRRLAHRVAEHDALVAGALLLAVGGIDALGDVGRLLVQVILHLERLPMEAALVVADVANAFAGDVLDPVDHRLRPAHLAADDQPVGRGEAFAGHPALGRFGEEGVEHRVRDAVADLVRMALGDRLGGEVIFRPIDHGCSPAHATERVLSAQARAVNIAIRRPGHRGGAPMPDRAEPVAAHRTCARQRTVKLLSLNAIAAGRR